MDRAGLILGSRSPDSKNLYWFPAIGAIFLPSGPVLIFIFLSFLSSFLSLSLFSLLVFTFSFLSIRGVFRLPLLYHYLTLSYASSIPGLIPTTTILIRTLIRTSSCPGPILYSLLGNGLLPDLSIVYTLSSCSMAHLFPPLIDPLGIGLFFFSFFLIYIYLRDKPANIFSLSL